MAAQSHLTVLLLGSGGREHALAHSLSRSPLVQRLLVAPGNGGTAALPKTTNLPLASASAADFPALAAAAREHGVNLLVPGPEAPLVDGVVDFFEKEVPGCACFGPGREAARLEGSKRFAKGWMGRWGVPTAGWREFAVTGGDGDGGFEEAKRYLEGLGEEGAKKVVLKASGLAAGKGVLLPDSLEEAVKALEEMMVGREFGDAGEEVVIEERLDGPELSVLTFCDGTTAVSLPPAQDHKRIFDGDLGPNTGGMGTYAPIPIATKELVDEIHRTVIEPTIKGSREAGFPFVGCLFTGLMLTSSGPKVLEYNVRFGDPETQSLLLLLETDLAELMLACAQGRLKDVALKVSNKAAVTVVVAAGGYPGSYKKGAEMKLDPVPDNVVLFHAGTSISDNVLRTSGGRVIAATAVADTLQDAVKGAYEGVSCIHFEGMQYRKDIAARAL